MKKNILFLTLMIICLAISAQQSPKPLTITPETHFVRLPEEVVWVSDLEDGVWTVKNEDGAYAFYLDDGRMLFDYEWTCNANHDPQMLGGAVVMTKKSGSYPKPQYILYRDGGVKELPLEWKGAATNFVDGVALIGTGNAYIYIDVNGKRVYGNLVSVPERFDGKNHTVPPLREGLRAYRSVTTYGSGDKWGFIDEKGNIVIPARFDKCRSFSEGYALVKEGRSMYFIDKKGNKAISLDFLADEDLMWGDVGDVRNGYFLVSGHERTYYNTKGEKQFQSGGATWFYEGYAFCDYPKNFDISQVIDVNFNVVGYTPKVMSSWSEEYCTPVFSPVGVATVEHNRVIAPDGTILIQHKAVSPKLKLPNPYGISDFTASGYAQAWFDNDRDRLHGFINLDGEFVIVYTWDHNRKFYQPDKNNPDYDPCHYKPCDTIVPPPPCDTCDPVKPPCDTCDPVKPPCDTCKTWYSQPPSQRCYKCIIEIPETTSEPPKPPKETRHEYTVTVVAEPAKGGTVSGGGKYLLGAEVPLGATPNKGWTLVKWECTTPGYYNRKLPSGVRIDGRDLSFVAKFKEKPKKDTIDSVSHSGCYYAHQTGVEYEAANVEYDVYMQMNADSGISTPYGEHTQGFLTCIMDPNKPLVYEDEYGKDIGISYKVFFVPMKISGVINEKDGKHYLVLDGGQFMASDIEFTGAGELVLGVANGILKYEGTIATLSQGRYRLEMLDYDESTGECTFGDLYRFHLVNGWVLADDFQWSESKTFYGSKAVSNAITGTLFKGARMKLCEPREVDFIPPEGWIKKGKEHFDLMLREQMQTLITDWEILFSNE